MAEYSYLNYAATSWPKPPAVAGAMQTALCALPDEAGRSNAGAGGTADACRAALAPLLGGVEAGRIYFYSSATEAANWLVRGMAEGRVAVTATEHNAVLRPLYALLPETDILVVPCDENGFVAPTDVETAFKQGAGRLFLNHASNVTGAVQDVEAIAALAYRYGAGVVLDASQSAGLLPVPGSLPGIEAVLFTGHKGLQGPQGTGGFYLAPGACIRPAKYGGTGSESGRLVPLAQDLYEPGTPNGPGLAGLLAGAQWVANTGLAAIGQKLEQDMLWLYGQLTRIPGVRVFSGAVQGGRPQGGAIAFTVPHLSPADLAYILYHSYGIIVRAGLHCAPLLHGYLGATGGTLRVSPGYATRPDELARLVAAVGEVAAEVVV